MLCLGPGLERALAQVDAVTKLGGVAVIAECATVDALKEATGFSGAIWWGDDASARAYRQALAARPGPILPLITGLPDQGHVRAERHVCVDTTAAGGNAALLAGQDG